jgi:hypothetical protein
MRAGGLAGRRVGAPGRFGSWFGGRLLCPWSLAPLQRGQGNQREKGEGLATSTTPRRSANQNQDVDHGGPPALARLRPASLSFSLRISKLSRSLRQ